MYSLRRALGRSTSSLTTTEHIVFILQSYSTGAGTRRTKPFPKSSSPLPENTDISENRRSTQIPFKPTVPQRPTEIPFQPKVANCINLIGHVQMPVQFRTSPDGKPRAATVIKRHESPDSPELRIPLIFEGDLAHIAACHLKENNYIHVAGQISADPPYLNENLCEGKVQIMVQSLNFVQEDPQRKPVSEVSNLEKVSSSSVSEKHDINRSRKDLYSERNEKHDINHSWMDLLSNPNNWWDVRSTEDNSKGAAFEQKKNGEVLFIDNSTPKWLLEKLELMTFDQKPELNGSKNSAKKDLGSLFSSWRDLLDDPKQWRDYRDKKLNKSVNPRHPDFKRKDGSISLWLNQAPKWVLSKLEGLEFDDENVKSEQAKEVKGDNSWRDLVENPDRWWDNRSNKRNERGPDFKHKETGEVLWLSDSPTWALSKLPPLKAKERVKTGG